MEIKPGKTGGKTLKRLRKNREKLPEMPGKWPDMREYWRIGCGFGAWPVSDGPF